MTYRMFTDTALHKFRDFCVTANISQRHPSPEGAYDAMPRMARDDAPDDRVAEAALHKKILDFLKNKLSEIDLFDVTQILTGEDLAGIDSAEPPDFPGKPKIGGGQVPLRAMDSLRARLDATDHKSGDAHLKLRQHLNRIGVV